MRCAVMNNMVYGREKAQSAVLALIVGEGVIGRRLPRAMREFTAIERKHLPDDATYALLEETRGMWRRSCRGRAAKDMAMRIWEIHLRTCGC